MGLDMYFYKKTYVGNKWKSPKELVKIDVKGVNQAKVVDISEEVGYLRKANAIHLWLVEKIQDGNDNCAEYYFSHEKIKELLDLVNRVLEASILVEGKINNGVQYSKDKEKILWAKGKVIKNPKVAQELLPTGSGFFFGSTDYDEYYIKDLEETKNILEEMLSDDTADYHYQSSW
jgi:hypothetical protein